MTHIHTPFFFLFIVPLGFVCLVRVQYLFIRNCIWFTVFLSLLLLLFCFILIYNPLAVIIQSPLYIYCWMKNEILCYCIQLHYYNCTLFIRINSAPFANVHKNTFLTNVFLAIFIKSRIFYSLLFFPFFAHITILINRI